MTYTGERVALVECVRKILADEVGDDMEAWVYGSVANPYTKRFNDVDVLCVSNDALAPSFLPLHANGLALNVYTISKSDVISDAYGSLYGGFYAFKLALYSRPLLNTDIGHDIRTSVLKGLVKGAVEFFGSPPCISRDLLSKDIGAVLGSVFLWRLIVSPSFSRTIIKLDPQQDTQLMSDYNNVLLHGSISKHGVASCNAIDAEVGKNLVGFVLGEPTYIDNKFWETYRKIKEMSGFDPKTYIERKRIVDADIVCRAYDVLTRISPLTPHLGGHAISRFSSHGRALYI